jgi:hypothetical protein
MIVRNIPAWALALVLGVGLSAGARAQDEIERPDDPYLKGERSQIKAAGYVDFDRFAWGDGHGTSDIEALLGQVPLLWLETDHFKIGSTLPEYTIDLEERASIKAELKQLSRRLPRVKKGTKTLDPWLRLYLYAQRLEDFYTDITGRLGVEDLPETGMLPGSQGKLCVLLLEKKSSLGRYGRRYGGVDAVAALRIYFPGVGSLCYVTCSEFFEDGFDKDVALHCQLMWGISQNVLSAYKGFSFSLPRWLADGVSYYYQRRVDPEYPCFSTLKGSMTAAIADSNWPRKVRARVKVDVYPDATTMMGWVPGVELPFPDHMMMFSRVDYLLTREDDSFARFMAAVKEPFVNTGQVPDYGMVRGRVAEALSSVYGFDEQGFDEAWAEWVLKTYPRR